MIIFSLGHQLLHSSVHDLSFIKIVPTLCEKVRQLIPMDLTM